LWAPAGERVSCLWIEFTAGKGKDSIDLMERAPQLVARDLFQSFRLGARQIEVLRGISMEIAHNEAVFLSGASGAGKTTLLYTLAGLERPESGTVEFEGCRLYSGSSAMQARLRNEKMGFVFQGYFLLPELTALENVLLPAMIARRPTRSDAEESLAAVGLSDRMQHLPAELSGGEQQRVAIARALTNNPDIIFADEPTGNLDSKTGDAIIDLLLNLARERNKTLLVVTHDARLAARGDRQLHIKDGVLQ
jgi:predicted ABC-type transport system involved in lysophospholipase L1 biosynthesis ATPase subunit